LIAFGRGTVTGSMHNAQCPMLNDKSPANSL
jgi:hypothetical protein